MIPKIQVVGYSNSGKTTLVSAMIQEFSKRGFRVSAIKHAHHGYMPDAEGKDSWKYLQAGAQSAIVACWESITFHQKLSQEKSLNDLCALITNVDLIIVEGYKNSPGQKIEVYRSGFSEARLDLGRELIGIVSDEHFDESVPQYLPHQITELVDFLVAMFFK